MTPAGQAFLGLTAIVTVLVAVLTFAVLKFLTAARQTGGRRESGMEAAFLTSALHDAVTKLKGQERAMAQRAEASERLADQIIENLSAGLLMVSDDGSVLIANPVGRRLLGLGEGPHEGRAYRELLAHAEPVAALIQDCLRTGKPILRRALELPSGQAAATHLGLTASALHGDGAAHGVICLFTDLTSVVALEEQVRLKDSLARVGELTAGIAHEFRNGLATIHGYSRLLDLDVMTADPLDAGSKQDAKVAGLLCGFHPLAILCLGTRKGFTAMGQRDGCAGLLGYAGCRFERAVAASDHQHVLLLVLFGIDQTVNHFGLVLPVHLQLARRSAPADGKHDRRGSIRSQGCPDFEFGTNLLD